MPEVDDDYRGRGDDRVPFSAVSELPRVSDEGRARGELQPTTRHFRS